MWFKSSIYLQTILLLYFVSLVTSCYECLKKRAEERLGRSLGPWICNGNFSQRIEHYTLLEISRLRSANCSLNDGNISVSVIVETLQSYSNGVNITFDDNVNVEILQQNTSRSITVVVSKWVGVASFNASTSNICDESLGHHPSNTRLLTFDYYDATNNETWMSSVPVRYQLDLSNDFNASMPDFEAKVKLTQFQCVRWNHTINTWIPLPCHEKPTKDALIKCGPCDVRTNMTLSYIICSDREEKVPVTATYVIEGISASFLFFTLVFLLLARLSRVKLPQSPILNSGDIRTNKFTVQFCACLALLSLHMFAPIAVQPKRIENADVCYFIAAGMHFSLLAAAFWLLNQGISLWLKISGKFPFHLNYNLLTGLELVWGWGVPLLTVALIANISNDEYVATNQFFLEVNGKVFTGSAFPPFIDCNFNREHKVAFNSVIATLAIIIILNVIVTIHTITIVHRINKNDAIRRHVHATDANAAQYKFEKQLFKLAYWKTTGKALFLLLPVSTFPWIIWMFALLGRSGVRIAFTVSSGLQGIAIFFIFCVVNSDERTRIRISWSRSRIRECSIRLFVAIFRRCRRQQAGKYSLRSFATNSSATTTTHI